MAAGAVSLRKSNDIVISSFCNIVKGQAMYDTIIGYCIEEKSYIKKVHKLRYRHIILSREYISYIGIVYVHLLLDTYTINEKKICNHDQHYRLLFIKI